jgi:outer membrane protein assembly factor BamA
MHAVHLPGQKKVLLNISDIILTGNKKTKSFIVFRELGFQTGEWLTQAELDKKMVLAKQQLMNTTLFVDVALYTNAAIDTSANRNSIIVHVDVKERWYLFPTPYFKLIDRNFNQWWVEQHRSLERVNYGLKFIQNNFTGRNDNVDIWLITGYTQQVTLRYDLPFIDRKLKSGVNIGFVYATQKELNYATGDNQQLFFKQDNEVKKSVRFDLTYSYRPDIKERHYFRISYNREQVADTVIKLNPLYYPGIRTSIRYIDFNYQYKYYNVDYISYPTKGFLFEGNLYSRGINRDADFWQASARAVYSIPLNPSTFLHFEGVAMVKLPFDNYFFNERLLGYGYFQMRGLEYNVVDGVLGGTLKSTIHKQLVSFVVKNPFPSKTHDKIPFRIFLKAYGDLGYGYTRNPIASNTLNNTLLRTWGFGMDIVSIYDFVFKIEYSFNQLGRDGLYLQSRNDF